MLDSFASIPTGLKPSGNALALMCPSTTGFGALLAFALYVTLKPVNSLLAQLGIIFSLGDSFLALMVRMCSFVRLHPTSLREASEPDRTIDAPTFSRRSGGHQKRGTCLNKRNDQTSSVQKITTRRVGNLSLRVFRQSDS